MFKSRADVREAREYLELACKDLTRSLDYSVGEYFWSAWQQGAADKINYVSRSIDQGYFGLPHPWDLKFVK
jgi:hypothetical protein